MSAKSSTSSNDRQHSPTGQPLSPSALSTRFASSPPAPHRSRRSRSRPHPIQHPQSPHRAPACTLNPRIFPSPIPRHAPTPCHRPHAASINARTDLPWPWWIPPPQTLMDGLSPSTPNNESQSCAASRSGPTMPAGDGRDGLERHVQGEVATGPSTGAARRAISPRTAPCAISRYDASWGCESLFVSISRNFHGKGSGVHEIGSTPVPGEPRAATVSAEPTYDPGREPGRAGRWIRLCSAGRL